MNVWNKVQTCFIVSVRILFPTSTVVQTVCAVVCII